jgi:NADH dehydrogenase
MPTTRVVVLGGGFGGLYAARALAARSLGGLEVSLVDRASDFVFKPLLYELLTGEVEERDIAVPFEEALAGTGVAHVAAEVAALDLARRRVLLTDGGALGFDAAVLALGAEPWFRGLPGLADHAFTAATIEDFRRLARHFGALGPAPGDLRARTVAICGAGPSGVEVAAKLADLMAGGGATPPHPAGVNPAGPHPPLRRFAPNKGCDGPEAPSRRAGAAPGAPWRIVLVEASASILPGFGEDVKARALRLLASKGVELRIETPVAGADREGLLLGGGGGERLPAATVIWTAGQRPAAVVRALPVAHDESGRVLVPATLEVPGHEAVFALGDCARCALEGAEAPPATAQVAVQQASSAARNILSRANGATLSSFRYLPLAETLSVGRGYDLFSVLGITLEGRPAHVVRRLAYLLRMPAPLRAKAWSGARFGARVLGEALGDAAARARRRLGL